MRVGLIDVDGRGFPNIALMRISAWHKSMGDVVEWWWTDFIHYDVVYKSKVFSDVYTKDTPDPINADRVVKGGSGYSISKNAEGREVFSPEANVCLPSNVEKMFPDYSIYPSVRYAVSMTSRGCPRGCAFCHVGAKEGRCSVKVADVSDFWNGQRKIVVLDPNITACKEKRDLMMQYRQTGAWIDFSQGLDIRLINEADVEDINAMKIERLHFAWDDANTDLRSAFYRVGKQLRIQDRRRRMVYVLTNYNSTIDEDLYRIYSLRDMNYDPYVMIYDKPSAPKNVRKLQRWVNNKRIFAKTRKFEEYD